MTAIRRYIIFLYSFTYFFINVANFRAKKEKMEVLRIDNYLEVLL